MNWLVATTKLMARGQQVASQKEASRERNRPVPQTSPSARQSTFGDKRLPYPTLAWRGSWSWSFAERVLRTHRCCCPARSPWLRRWIQACHLTGTLSAHLRNSVSARNSRNSRDPTFRLYQQDARIDRILARQKKKHPEQENNLVAGVRRGSLP